MDDKSCETARADFRNFSANLVGNAARRQQTDSFRNLNRQPANGHAKVDPECKTSPPFSSFFFPFSFLL